MKRVMRYTKILIVAIVALLCSVLEAEAQVASTRYTVGDDANNEIVDTVDFDLSLPVMTEGDGKLYYIRKINVHGVKYLNHSILKASAGLQEGDSIYRVCHCEERQRPDVAISRYYSPNYIAKTNNVPGDCHVTSFLAMT